MTTVRTAAAAGLLMARSPPARAGDAGRAIKRGLYDEASLSSWTTSTCASSASSWSRAAPAPTCRRPGFYGTWTGGLDLDLIWGPVTLTATCTQAGSVAAYRTPHGTRAGYTSMIVKDFDRASEGAFLFGAKLDLSIVDVPGFALCVATG
jgi:hypothetical protein